MPVDRNDTRVDVLREIDALVCVILVNVAAKEARNKDVLNRRLVVSLLRNGHRSKGLTGHKVAVRVGRIVGSVGVVELREEQREVLMKLKVVLIGSSLDSVETTQEVDLHGQIGVRGLLGDVEEGVEFGSRSKRLEGRLADRFVEGNDSETLPDGLKRCPALCVELADVRVCLGVGQCCCKDQHGCQCKEDVSSSSFFSLSSHLHNEKHKMTKTRR